MNDIIIYYKSLLLIIFLISLPWMFQSFHYHHFHLLSWINNLFHPNTLTYAHIYTYSLLICSWIASIFILLDSDGFLQQFPNANIIGAITGIIISFPMYIIVLKDKKK